MHKLLSEMPNISDHFITLWSMLGTVVAAVVAAVSLIIYAVIYKAQLRHLKWSANH